MNSPKNEFVGVCQPAFFFSPIARGFLKKDIPHKRMIYLSRHECIHKKSVEEPSDRFRGAKELPHEMDTSNFLVESL